MKIYYGRSAVYSWYPYIRAEKTVEIISLSDNTYT